MLLVLVLCSHLNYYVYSLVNCPVYSLVNYICICVSFFCLFSLSLLSQSFRESVLGWALMTMAKEWNTCRHLDGDHFHNMASRKSQRKRERRRRIKRRKSWIKVSKKLEMCEFGWRKSGFWLFFGCFMAFFVTFCVIFHCFYFIFSLLFHFFSSFFLHFFILFAHPCIASDL